MYGGKYGNSAKRKDPVLLPKFVTFRFSLVKVKILTAVINVETGDKTISAQVKNYALGRRDKNRHQLTLEELLAQKILNQQILSRWSVLKRSS